VASLWEAQPAVAERPAHENLYHVSEDKKTRREVLIAVLDVQDDQNGTVQST